MKQVKRIKAWQTSDGLVHSTPEEANRHESHMEVRRLVANLGMGRGGPWDEDMIADALIAHADLFSEATAAVVVWNQKGHAERIRVENPDCPPHDAATATGMHDHD